MTNKRQLKSNRFLPEYVTRYRDRHGKWRYRFRRAGFPGGHFTAPLGTEAFREEYARFNDPAAPSKAARESAQARIIPGSAGDLQHRYYSVPERLGPTEQTQIKVKSVLDRGFFDGRTAWPVAGITFEHIDAMVAARKVKFKNEETNRWEGGIEAAKKLRKELVRLFDFAIKTKLMNTNPAAQSQQVKVPAGERSTGFYAWTEEDILAYRARWALGTKQRLAMELMLWTDQRKIDAIHLGRQHIRGGKFVIRQTKTGKTLTLPIAAPLANAIAAMPPSDHLCFIMTEWGKPFSVKGFGGWFREQCDAAGLSQCTAHGLRKATMRRMAELEMPNKSMKSVSGHSKDDEVARYTATANQAKLADAAIKRLVEWEMSNPVPGLDTDMEQSLGNAS